MAHRPALIDTGPREPREIVALCGISSPSLAGIPRPHGRSWPDPQVPVEATSVASPSPHHESRKLAQTMAPQIEAVYAEIEIGTGQGIHRRYLPGAGCDDRAAGCRDE